MTASALSLAQTPLYMGKFVPALAMITATRQNIENTIFSLLMVLNDFTITNVDKNSEISTPE